MIENFLPKFAKIQMKTSIPFDPKTPFFNRTSAILDAMLIRFVATSQQRNLDEEARKIKECPQVGSEDLRLMLTEKTKKTTPSREVYGTL